MHLNSPLAVIQHYKAVHEDAGNAPPSAKKKSQGSSVSKMQKEMFCQMLHEACTESPKVLRGCTHKTAGSNAEISAHLRQSHHSVVETYTCKKCSLRLNSPLAVIQHYKALHEDAGKAPPSAKKKAQGSSASKEICCQLLHTACLGTPKTLRGCTHKTARNNAEVLAHLLQSHHWAVETYSCRKCSMHLNSPLAVIQHYKVVHEDAGNAPLPGKKKTPGSSTTPKEAYCQLLHKACLGTPKTLRGCTHKTARSNAEVLAHLRQSHHWTVETYTCKKCSLRLNSPLAVIQHYKAVHEDAGNAPPSAKKKAQGPSASKMPKETLCRMLHEACFGTALQGWTHLADGRDPAILIYLEHVAHNPTIDAVTCSTRSKAGASQSAVMALLEAAHRNPCNTTLSAKEATEQPSTQLEKQAHGQTLCKVGNDRLRRVSAGINASGSCSKMRVPLGVIDRNFPRHVGRGSESCVPPLSAVGAREGESRKESAVADDVDLNAMSGQSVLSLSEENAGDLDDPMQHDESQPRPSAKIGFLASLGRLEDMLNAAENSRGQAPTNGVISYQASHQARTGASEENEDADAGGDDHEVDETEHEDEEMIDVDADEDEYEDEDADEHKGEYEDEDEEMIDVDEDEYEDDDDADEHECEDESFEDAAEDDDEDEY
ncbi:hypothetical protein DIPPA_17745 [Diplonema papillatum]|nr:hypothetical protein DIPPA_17745 [Diplonema papillatum]